MRVRGFRADDEPALKAAYLARGFPGGWRPLHDAVLALVVVDDDDRPVMLAAAHPAVEVRLAVDREWATPGMREEALKQVHAQMAQRLANTGYRRAVALIEPAIAKSFGRRLTRLFGWLPCHGVAYERQV